MINSIEELKMTRIRTSDIPELVKDLSDLGYSFLSKDTILKHVKKYGVVTFYKKGDDSQELRLLCSLYEPKKSPDYIEIMDVYTNEDYRILYVPHGLQDGFDRDNLILEKDEHTLSGLIIIYGNLTTKDLKHIEENKTWEYNGYVYPVEIIEEI